MGDHEKWVTAKSRRLYYSVGMVITEEIQAAILQVSADGWTPAYGGDGQVRKCAWVTDITGMLDLENWPAGMRAIVRKEVSLLLETPWNSESGGPQGLTLQQATTLVDGTLWQCWSWREEKAMVREAEDDRPWRQGVSSEPLTSRPDPEAEFPEATRMGK